ncbi:hypothetical protein MTQ01_23295 [Streptomyces sp. XM4193]|uniref:hypothetical protein n=1 Tax=Streptomyces sp. XM4193 TaxID=2929782 RepID=UPI001FFABFF0|nr:hypothetical protein [Streptomyces sp. XM4193]MCK1798897.1 hypothetical protein [Streptomyces sp. XM4193]
MSAGSVWPEPHKTTFAYKELGELRAMLDGADPKTVSKVADSWGWISKVLVESEGNLKDDFDKAVAEVLEHWSGDAAEGFRKRANKISKKIAEAASRAKAMEQPMRNVATVLQSGINQLNEVKDPGKLDRAADKTGNVVVQVVTLGKKGGRDDSGANADIAAGRPTQEVLDKHATELSEGKERALKAAIALEYVGGGYRTYAKSIQSSGRNFRDPNFDDTDYDGGVPAVVPFPGGGIDQKNVKPMSTPTGLDGTGINTQTPTSPRPDGITGGIGTGGQSGPQVGTGLNSAGPGVGGGGVNAGNLGGLSTGSAPTGAANGTGIGTPGALGAGGAAMRAGGAGGRVAGTGGRMGAPGMGGGAGARQGGNNKKGGSGRGALAKQRGGVVGAAGKGAARAQGGSGLHRSRGGKQAAGQKGKGMMGAPGTRGTAGKDDKERKERPDYLVEDEETWVPNKTVAPRIVD